MSSKFQLVREFNQHILNLQPSKIFDTERKNWFNNVILEELEEFRGSWALDDRVGMFDALIDMTYFILGRVYELGFSEYQWDKAFEIVHNCNMTKKKGNKNRGSDTDAIKDDSWVGPEKQIKELLFKMNNSSEEETEAYGYTEQNKTSTLDTLRAKADTIKLQREIYPPLDENTIVPINYKPGTINKIKKHGPSIYLEQDGEQRILDIDEVNLLAKMSPVFREVTKIALKKAADYNRAKNNRSIYFPFGLLSYAQMLHVKSQRLNSLAQQDNEPNNESIRDTLLDLINYATFAVEAIDKGEI